MSEITDPLAWVARAEEDYTVARACLRRKKALTSSACFHAQQCVEKYLKGTLMARGQVFPKTHDLLALSTLCAQASIFLEVTPDQLATLSSYAVQVRYPGDNPTLEEAKEALEIAKAVRRSMRKLLGLKSRRNRRQTGGLR